MASDKINLPEGFHDLGEDSNHFGAVSVADESPKSSVHYPCLYFSGKNELKDLPKEGMAVIKYKKVMESEKTHTRDGKSETTYSTELEIYGIKPEESGEYSESESAKEEPSDEDAIDKGLEAASKATEE